MVPRIRIGHRYSQASIRRGVSSCTRSTYYWGGGGKFAPNMGNVIGVAIDIDFLEVLTSTIDFELTILDSLTLPLTLRLVNDCMQLLTLRSELLTLL